MKILVTGADGFVGTRCVASFLRAGHTVTAAVRPGGSPDRLPAGTAVVPLELLDDDSVGAAVCTGPDAVVHLAAVASGAAARQDPGTAWVVNAAGTARLAEAVARTSPQPILLLASTAEVYGAGDGTDRPREEDDAVHPCSPYAASKAAAEIAVREVARRTGLRAVIARAFPHTGPGQDGRFVVPAFARRLLEARAHGREEVEVGNLDAVRDFLHVDDVVEAYGRLLTNGISGGVYNVASGQGVSIRELFERLAELVGVAAMPRTRDDLLRPSDIPHLVGNPGRLAAATGWRPSRSLDLALREVVDAQAD